MDIFRIYTERAVEKCTKNKSVYCFAGGPKILLQSKRFLLKKFWVQKYLDTKNCVKKNLGIEQNFVSKKMNESKTKLIPKSVGVPKIFWVEKFCDQN